MKTTGTPKFIRGMRDTYFDSLFPFFQKDKNLIMVSADNGAPSLDQFVQTLPGQFFNVGIAEASAVGMAAGLAFEGKKSFAYAIAPFISSRVYEQVKLDVCAMNLPVTLLGVGAGYAYDIMGPSHHTTEDISIMRALPHLEVYSPADPVCSSALAQLSVEAKGPQYIRFDRAGIGELYTQATVNDFRAGLSLLKQGKDISILSTGVMVHQALAAAEELEKKGISAAVIDLYRIKPLNVELLLSYCTETKAMVTVEEHLLAGGVGGLIAETFSDEGISMPLLRLGQNDQFVFDYGGREVIWEKTGLDTVSLTQTITNWTENKFAPVRRNNLR